MKKTKNTVPKGTINLKKTFANCKRNITANIMADAAGRSRQNIYYYMDGTVTRIPPYVNEALIELFTENGDEVFYKD